MKKMLAIFFQLFNYVIYPKKILMMEFTADFDTTFKGKRANHETYSSKHELSVSYFKHFINDSMFKHPTHATSIFTIEKSFSSANVIKEEMEQYFGKKKL